MSEATPWWISIWPSFGIIYIVATIGLAIFLIIRFLKFTGLGILVFKDYLEKNKKQ